MKPLAPWPQRGLYLITPDEADTQRLLERVRPVLAAGPALLQYRNKAAGAALRRDQARELLALCRSAGLPLIINDDWRLAADLGADGAHLGGGDGSLSEARAALGPDALLGASCYDQLALAEGAAADGASYVAFGAFFPSGTKPGARRADPALLKASTHLNLTRVAIGGITPDNARIVIAAGAEMVAVIAGVFDSPDPAASVRGYRRCFDLPSLSNPPE